MEAKYCVTSHVDGAGNNVRSSNSKQQHVASAKLSHCAINCFIRFFILESNFVNYCHIRVRCCVITKLHTYNASLPYEWYDDRADNSGHLTPLFTTIVYSLGDLYSSWSYTELARYLPDWLHHSLWNLFVFVIYWCCIVCDTLFSW